MSRSWFDTLRDLREAERLARSLEGTAPGVVALEGGGDMLVRLHGRPTGALFCVLILFPKRYGRPWPQSMPKARGRRPTINR